MIQLKNFAHVHGGTTHKLVLGVSVFGVSVFGVSVFGVSVFGVGVFGVGVFGASGASSDGVSMSGGGTCGSGATIFDVSVVLSDIRFTWAAVFGYSAILYICGVYCSDIL